MGYIVPYSSISLFFNWVAKKKKREKLKKKAKNEKEKKIEFQILSNSKVSTFSTSH